MWMKPQMHGELEGIKLERSLRLGFRASNNEAEYEALLAGLRVVKILGATEVEIYSDSRLVVSQVEGSLKVKDPRMVEFLRLVNFLRKSFDRVKVTQISRGKNSHADSLATLASSVEDSVPRIISMEEVDHPSIERLCCVVVASIPRLSWMDPITTFIIDGLLLSDQRKVDKVHRKSARFCLSEERNLY